MPNPKEWYTTTRIITMLMVFISLFQCFKILRHKVRHSNCPNSVAPTCGPHMNSAEFSYNSQKFQKENNNILKFQSAPP